MNIDRFRVISEAIALVIVAASLIAVVIELRQTQAAIVTSTYQARAFDAIAVRSALADSEFLLPLLVNTNYGCDEQAISMLDDVDKARIREFLWTEMFDLDNEFYQYERGNLDADFFETAYKPRLLRFATRWRNLGVTENRQSFAEFTDDLLSAARADNSDRYECI